MILVTGAAGYIGSHTLRALLAAGHKAQDILVLDNLYSGHRQAVPQDIAFIEGSTGDAALLEKIFSQHKIESILHFAAHLEVEESVRIPEKYYQNNFVGSATLIDAAYRHKVSSFVFSSTCATVGTPRVLPVDEKVDTRPESPYGKSKLMTEWYLADKLAAARLAGTHEMHYAALRYFNVAGAHVHGGIGQSTPRATQLIKVASEVITGKRPKLLIYGTDYPTPDGTCIRDYIHVDDLAEAHVLALKFLQNIKRSEIFNLGYGHGYSVKEIVDTLKRVSGVNFPTEEVPRRPGDAEAIYADNTKARTQLGWTPRYDDIELICKTAIEWEKTRSF
jgi:UDP-glucose 4-epimerase